MSARGAGKKLVGDVLTSGGILSANFTLAPWCITGPASHAEWRDVPLLGSEYRSISPSTVSGISKVPHTSPSRIYDSRHFSRDARRFRVLNQGETHNLSPTSLGEKIEELTTRALRLKGSHHTDMYVSRRVGLLDDPDGGFS